MLDIILNYIMNSSIITIVVLILLSFYLIITIWIFFYKNIQLSGLINIEKLSLEKLLSNYGLDPLSKFGQCTDANTPSKEILDSYEITFIKDASTGLSWLSIISSTAPFIGLFGTVIGILESFAKFSTKAKVSFSIIAPAISEALVATAGGIFVAIFAYTFHQIISRKVYEFNVYLKSQAKILLSKQ